MIRLQSLNMTSSTAERPRLCLTFWFSAFGAGDSTQLRILTVDSESKVERGFMPTILLLEETRKLILLLVVLKIEIWMLRVGQLDPLLLRSSDWNFAQVELQQNNNVNENLGRNIHL